MASVPVNFVSATPEAHEQDAENMLYNHACATLSELDMEIVRSVPSGGNWSDLPAATIAKSARLTQIYNSGGRTTYYGRLSGELPSYTINTYFNRPGNGTFIHPTQDRLISMREAARLQSFPDRYRFLGSFSSRFKQIGNAVPPLLGKVLGAGFKHGSYVDLFCGAGGLSEGLRQAGHRVIVATDVNRHMCNTYRLNHENATVVQANILNDSDTDNLMDTIESRLKGRTLNLLAGGPPCQGFSTAGKRSPSDVRNSLIFRTLVFIQRLRPENVLIENVPGIQWMHQGRLLKTMLDALTREGYHPSTLVLKAEEYGVPQRRRRVFIVATQNGDLVEAPDALFSAVARHNPRGDSLRESMFLPPPIAVSEAIQDLPEIPSGGGVDSIEYDRSRIDSDYQRYMRGLISIANLIAKRAEQG